jgi:hypothetical protein
LKAYVSDKEIDALERELFDSLDDDYCWEDFLIRDIEEMRDGPYKDPDGMPRDWDAFD